MPAAAPLTAEQQQYVDNSQCACGCGVALESYPEARWGRQGLISNWATSACRQRCYRQRVTAGTVRTRKDRRREKELLHAAQLEQDAKWTDQRAKSAAKEAIRLAAQAASIRERWAAEAGGQLPLGRAA